MRTFTIQRSTWIRGNQAASALRTSEGLRCCLGFYVEACGVRPTSTTNQATPRELANIKRLPNEARWLVVVDTPVDVFNSPLCKELMRVNDEPEDEPEDGAMREAEITRLFAVGGVRVVFQD